MDKEEEEEEEEGRGGQREGWYNREVSCTSREHQISTDSCVCTHIRIPLHRYMNGLTFMGFQRSSAKCMHVLVYVGARVYV